MDKLRKEIKGIKNVINHIEPALVQCYAGVKDMERTHEYIENRMSINENMNDRITRLECYIDVMCKSINETITRVNTIHTYLKEQEDLQCHEKLEKSDDESS